MAEEAKSLRKLRVGLAERCLSKSTATREFANLAYRLKIITSAFDALGSFSNKIILSEREETNTSDYDVEVECFSAGNPDFARIYPTKGKILGVERDLEDRNPWRFNFSNEEFIDFFSKDKNYSVQVMYKPYQETKEQ